MRESSKTVLSVLGVIALAGAFWLLLIGPKREKASELSEQAVVVSAEVARFGGPARRSRRSAKGNFLPTTGSSCLLGKAVPAEADTPSLLVQLNGLSRRAETSFRQHRALWGRTSECRRSRPGENRRICLPLAAAVGTGPDLPAMPYTIEFSGGFFQIANFIEGLDSLSRPRIRSRATRGRLVMIDGFTLTPARKKAKRKEELGRMGR